MFNVNAFVYHAFAISASDTPTPETAFDPSAYTLAYQILSGTQTVIPSLVDQSVVYDVNAYTRYQYANASLVDQNATYNPTAFNLKQFFSSSASIINQSTVYSVQSVYNKIQYVSASAAINQSTVYNVSSVTNIDQFVSVAALINQSTVYNVSNVYNVDQWVTATLVDQSVVYSITVKITQYASANLIDQSVVYNVSNIANLDTTYNAAAAIDQSSVYSVSSVTNLLQVFDAPSAIDQSTVYNVASVANLNASYLVAIAIDQSNAFNPTAFNYIQYFSAAADIDQSFVQSPTISNVNQILNPVAINDWSIYVADAYNKNRTFSAATSINQSTVYNASIYLDTQVLLGAAALSTGVVYSPTAYNLKQVVLADVPFTQSTVYNPVVDLSNRSFAAASAINQSVVYGATLANLNRTFDAASAFDQSAVYNPTLTNKDQWVTATLVNQSSTYNPSADNSSIDIHPSLISQSTVYGPDVFSTDKTYDAASVINQSTVYALTEVSHRVRTLYLPAAIDQSIVYAIESVDNVNQEIQPTLVDQSSVLPLADVLNANRTFSAAAAINQSAVYNPTLFNADVYYDAASGINQSAVYTPDIDNSVRYISPTDINQSTVYSPSSTGPIEVQMQALAANSGEYANADLFAFNNHVLFPQSKSNSESMFCELALSAGAEMLALAGTTGERIEAFSLVDDFPGISNAISNSNGERVTVSGLEEDYLIKGYAGETTLPVQLTTEYVIDVDFDVDSWCVVTLDDHPSFYLPTPFAAVDGVVEFVTLNALYEGALIKPYRINSQPAMEAYFDYPFKLDLSQDCGCSGQRPFVHTNLDFDFDNGEKIFDKFWGEAQYMYVELSCQRYLSAVFYAGEEAKLKRDEEFVLSVDPIESGIPYSVASLNFDINRFRLCKGNFNPSGNNVPLEMYDALGDNCQEHFAYTGESMETVVQNNVQLYANARVGTNNLATLTIDPPMQTIPAPDPTKHVELSVNTTFQGAAWSGESAYATIYEEKIYAYTGEAMLLASITIEYSVEFLESGTILNEYVYQLPNGDVDTEKTRIAPTEGYFYSHYLKARCF